MAENSPQGPAQLPETVRADTVMLATAGAPDMDMDILAAEARSHAASGPAMTPPGEEVEAELTSGSLVWHYNKKIVALWANSSTRNAYASVAGLGWRKLSNANDSAHLSLTMLASTAEQTNANVNLQVGSDNEIHQIYVW